MRAGTRRRPGVWVKLAWQSHYPGSVRIPNSVRGTLVGCAARLFVLFEIRVQLSFVYGFDRRLQMAAVYTVSPIERVSTKWRISSLISTRGIVFAFQQTRCLRLSFASTLCVASNSPTDRGYWTNTSSRAWITSWRRRLWMSST